MRAFCLSAALLLLSLPVSSEASFLGTLIWGKDTLEPVRLAIKQTKHLRSEVLGWYHHNTTQQGNFTVSPDPPDLYSVLPTDYSGRSLVTPDGSYYSDIEGYYKGSWSGWDFSTQANRSLAIDSKLNHTIAERISKGAKEKKPEYVEGVKGEKLTLDRGKFDWLNGQPGHIDLHLEEEHLLKGNVSLITGSLSFEPAKDAQGSSESVDFSLEGLHFIPTASVFLHAIGDDTPAGTDVRTVLSLIPQGNNQTTNVTVSAISKAFQLRIDMLNRIIASGSYDASDSSPEPPTPKHNCSLHVYAQLSSAGPHSTVQPLLDTLERESHHPTGISTIPPPPLSLSLTAFSPECQLLLTSSSPLTGLLQTRLWKKAINYAIVYFFILLLQTYLLVQQMESTQTPSGLMKVSDKTWLAQSVLDAYSCLVHLSVAVALENETTKVLLGVAFMAGICFLGFGYRYTINVYRTQMDAAPTPPPTVTPTAAPVAVPASTEGEQAQPTEQQSNAEAPTTANTTTASPEELTARRRGALILAVGVFLFSVAFFPLITVSLLLPFLYSFWIPQIFRNVQRGTRKAILTRTVIGTTLTRLFLPLYIFACPDNVFFTEPSGWAWVLAAYVGGQMVLLLGQDLLGPHWFLPSSWVPEGAMSGWEYHPEVKEEEGEGDVEERAGEEQGQYGDCAICLSPIETRSARRRKRSHQQSPGERGWFSSRNGYDRISDAAEYEVEEERLFPAEKASSNTISPSTSIARPQARRSTMGRRLRSSLARTIDSVLRWKDDLGSATGTKLGVGGKRRRMDVMVAPCAHAFHTECLEQWLGIKNECPSCRAVLPAI